MSDPHSKLEFVSPKAVTDLSEMEIQREFERHLEKLDDSGIRYIGSFINIGVGIIDTLGLDNEGQPVIFEYKKPNADSTGALIQAMDYWAYCSQHFNHLKAIILGRVKELKINIETEIVEEIRLVIVASDFDERLQRAVAALSPDVMLLSYKLVSRDDRVLLIPNPKVTSTALVYKREPKPPKKLEDHFVGKEKLRPLFDKLVERLRELKLPFSLNPQPQNYIGIQGDRRTFAGFHPKKDWIRIDLPLSSSEAAFEGYKPWSEKDDSGYLHFKSDAQLSLIAGLLEKAYRKTQEGNQ